MVEEDARIGTAERFWSRYCINNCKSVTRSDCPGALTRRKLEKVLCLRPSDQRPCTRIVCDCDAWSHSVSMSTIILFGEADHSFCTFSSERKRALAERRKAAEPSEL